MIRRSVSSWLSPGPRVPIPPPVRLQVRPQPGQARQLVLELGELDLEPALVGLGVEGEDVEDQPAAVDDLDVEQLLERALLGRRQLVVGDEHVEAGLALGRDELLRLALADVPVRVDVAPVLPLGADDLGTRGRRQVGQLGERVLGRPAVVATRVDGDEEGLLDGDGEIDELMGHAPAGYAIVDGPPQAGPSWVVRQGRVQNGTRGRCVGDYPVRCS